MSEFWRIQLQNLSAAVDDTLNSLRPMFHSQVTLGAVFDKQEVFAGYNYYDIGGAELGGVIVGLRFRF